MKASKVFTVLLVCVFVFGVVTIASADDPPESDSDLPKLPGGPPLQGSSEPFPIQNAHAVLDPATVSVTEMELAEDGESLVIPSPTFEVPPPVKGSTAPGPMMLAGFDSGTIQPVPDSAGVANDLLIGTSRQSPPANNDISIAASTSIMSEGFEGVFNPPTTPPGWSRSSPPVWDDVDCFPLESTGVRSAWAADLAGLNPCSPDFDDYPSNVDSWLVYGPFSLADAQSASLDFFFRLDSEQGDDFFWWTASINEVDWYGSKVSGNYTSGPFKNGYNFVSFDLTDVYTLGNLSGQPQVWIAFIFQSDDDTNVGKGAFIDAIFLSKNTDPRNCVTDETFDVADFPNSRWQSFDLDGSVNGEYYWDDVAYLIQGPSCPSHSGLWSMWAADEGANGLDPCQGDSYANNMKSWMIHGPFSLEGASEAWIDFYYRNESELDRDKLFWGASIDGSTFYGISQSGSYTEGPFGNGYNLMRFYLSNVYTLGDLRGEPEVWLAFIFQSNETFTFQGPFIDDVCVAVERPTSAPPANPVFLPIIFQSAKAKTNLFITNQTGGVIDYYKVFNPKLNGAPIPDIVCSNIPAGAVKFDCHATFDTDTYRAESKNTCNPPITSGQVAFQAGDDVRKIFCYGN